MNHAMYSTDRHTYLQIVVIILLCAVCYQGDASEELTSKSAREWLQLTIRLSAPDMPDGAPDTAKQNAM
jgi:hypothetical protein